LVEEGHPPEDAYLVVQLEAAERFAGAPYGPETMASLLAKPWWHVEIPRWLRRTDFDPPPRVDSVLLWLARRTRPLVAESERRRYEEFVRSAFGRRGGTMHQCLRWTFTGRQIGRLTGHLRFERSVPPSTLSFDQWLGLFRFYMLDRTQDYRKTERGR
jgi:16S rRNA A1518/A1519 N6-dimethyltransferase RsmA/KsgA/DIM1 with predicted DNA glycosylase/AP lyase activity